MSFFDDPDEPTAAAPRRRPPSRGGGGSADHQTVLIRRLAAAGIAVLVVVLLVVGVKGCLDSQKTSALKDFNRNVATIVGESDTQVSRPFFKLLTGAAGRSPTDLQNQVNQLRVVADEEVGRARGLDAPDEMSAAKSAFVLVLELRQEGVGRIARLLQPALSKNAQTASAAVERIAGQMRAFDASDVIYTLRVAPQIAKALDDDGIVVGGTGERVATTKFLPDIRWLDPTFVAAQLGASGGGGTSGKAAPGLHGHQLDSVSVGGTDLSANGPNTVPATPPPTFTVAFTNGGQNDESRVAVKVSVEGGGKSIEGSATVAKTTAGQSTTADVRLSASPPSGQALTVKVTVAPVPGEQNVDNNTLSFPVTFS